MHIPSSFQQPGGKEAGRAAEGSEESRAGAPTGVLLPGLCSTLVKGGCISDIKRLYRGVSGPFGGDTRSLDYVICLKPGSAIGRSSKPKPSALA